MEPIETAFHDMQEEMKDYDNQSGPLKKDLKKAKDRMATARRMLNEQQVNQTFAVSQVYQSSPLALERIAVQRICDP
jgi:predicted  nucleic acid-binding Zn-ribbon protein